MSAILIQVQGRWKPVEWKISAENIEVDFDLLRRGGIPNPLFDRKAANEAHAVGVLRTIGVTCITYSSTYGQYPPNLMAMAPPSTGRPSAGAADLLDLATALGDSGGYTLLYEASDRNGDGKLDSYTVHAWPKKPGSTGRRYFFTDQTGIMRVSESGPAGPSAPPL
ncbi:MAG: hypothetical protein L0338_33815 [Acidobacteria bacterium]|nr:hypothetical protein [Acidobacteriota bacterium]